MSKESDTSNAEREVSLPGSAESRCDQKPDYKPKTPLGQRLCEIRNRLVASGETLLDWEQIELEVAERRGTERERAK